MKKLIVSTIAAAAIATTASAGVKVGVGIDVMTNITNPAASSTSSLAANLGSTPVIRIAIDGLVDGLRVEPRLAYISATNSTTGTDVKGSFTAFGLGGYYDLSKVVSVGAYYDMYTIANDALTDDVTGSSLGVVIKGEAKIADGFTIASELGFASTTTKPNNGALGDLADLHPVTSVTLRYFF